MHWFTIICTLVSLALLLISEAGFSVNAAVQHGSNNGALSGPNARHSRVRRAKPPFVRFGKRGGWRLRNVDAGADDDASFYPDEFQPLPVAAKKIFVYKRYNPYPGDSEKVYNSMIGNVRRSMY